MAFKIYLSKLAEDTFNMVSVICITDFERLKVSSIPLLQRNKRL